MREEQEELYLIPYRQAAEVLPEHLRRAALARCADEQAVAEELRLRSGQKMSLLGPEGETSISEEPVTGQDLQAVLDPSGVRYGARGLPGGNLRHSCATRR